MKILKIIEIVKEENILAGSPRGRTLLAQLIKLVNQEKAPEPLFLDFASIEVATGSFLRTFVLGFRDYCVSAELNVIPVVANLNEEMLEEMNLILDLKSDAILSCSISNKNQISNAKVLGKLEEKQLITLDTVLREKEVNAVDLEKKYWEQEKIKATGWNNRLTSLVTKGILMEIKRGRQKFYRPVLEVEYGC
jgi:hypothetical protein